MIVRPLSRLLLDDAADRPIASSGGRSINLAQFRVDVAGTIARLGATSGRRGLIVCDDAYWATVGMFALAHSAGETVFAPNTLPATIAALAGAYDYVLSDGAMPEASIRLEPAAGVPAAVAPMNADSACVALFTSGSSGPPKRIFKTLRQLELEAETVERVLGAAVPKAARVHATVVHHHLYGLTFRLCWPLATGHPFFGNHHQFWEPLLANLQAGDVVVTTPSLLSRLGGLPPLPPDRRPSTVLSGGAPLSDAAAEAARTLLGCAVREFMGSTETGVVGSRIHIEARAASWRPLPGVSVTRGDDGRMHVRSPYIVNPEDEQSNDQIEFDEDGGFRLLGRADRVAKIEGIRISLAEFDALLSGLPGVIEAGVVVLDDGAPYLGGVVVLDATGKKELAEVGGFRLGRRLRHDLSASLPAAALPRRWRFVTALPTGALGKVGALDLAALFYTAEGDALSPSPKIEPDVRACRKTAGGVELDLRITADLASLEGHFPQLPIVPGVCLVDWAARFAVRHVGFLDDGPTKLQIKFRRVLQPEHDVTLTLHGISRRRIRFEYRHLDTVYSSGTISSEGA